MRALTQAIACRATVVELAVDAAGRRTGQRERFEFRRRGDVRALAGLAASRHHRQPRLAPRCRVPALDRYAVRRDPDLGAGLLLEHAQRCNRETRMILVAQPPEWPHMSELSRDDHTPLKHQEVALASPGSPPSDA